MGKEKIVEIDGERKRKHADQMRKRETSTIGGASIVEIDGERKRKHADQMRKRETSTIGGAKPLTEVPQNIQSPNPSEFQESSSPRPKRSVSEPLTEVPQNIQSPNPSEFQESSLISENLTPFNHNLKDSATDPGTCDTPVNEAPQPLTPRRNPWGSNEFQESSQISENLTPFNHNLKDSATDPGTCDTPVNEAPQPLTPRRNPSRNRRPPARSLKLKCAAEVLGEVPKNSLEIDAASVWKATKEQSL
ncbi:hypothetical protein QE152_g13610 [Popillia japonica]|uniref:Uncharacterized protein n=1 Tax=Popillia japonica TaxID=7064 RepID=A0AAW1LDB8_POPJA